MSVRVLRISDPPLPPDEVVPENNLAEIGNGENGWENTEAQSNRELCLYRDRTVMLLRRYLRLALEAGRLPSLLGREFFRTRISGYQTHTFEDVVIFVHDVERSLEELNRLDQTLIAMIVLEERSQEEAAHLLGYTRRTVVRCYPEALDRVSEIFLRRHILERFAGCVCEAANSCQEAKNSDSFVSDCDNGKNNF